MATKKEDVLCYYRDRLSTHQLSLKQLLRRMRLVRYTRATSGLSIPAVLSCATCHDPEHAFSDGRTLAQGINSAEGTRNVPAIINRGYGTSFFWDGRAIGLEQQVLEPITNPKELGLTEQELERRTGMKVS